jgi:hypothetical protein
MSLLLGSLALIGIVVLVILLGAGAIAMIARSRGKHGTSGSLSSAALEIQSLLEPEKKRVVETMRVASEAEDEDAINGKK